MSDASPSPSTRSPRWASVLLLLLLTAAGLWALDGHQPSPWPDATTPWAAYSQAAAPVATVLDRANGVTLTPDLPLGSALVIGLVGALLLAAVQAAGVPTALAVTTAAGVLATRSVWSTATFGADASAVAAVSGLVLASTRPAGRIAWWCSLGLLALVAPSIGWVAVPLAVLAVSTARARLTAALVFGPTVPILLVVMAWWSHRGLPMAPADELRHAVMQVLLPGASAASSAWMALRQALAVFLGDVHLYGAALAVFGCAVAGPPHAAVRRLTLAWVAGLIVTVAVGALSPTVAAAALLPWWAVWSAVGAQAVVARVGERQRRLAMAFVVVAAIALPLLRHATVVPGPWVGGQPAMARASVAAFGGRWLASEDARETRRWRAAGGLTIPADGRTLQAALARGIRVAAAGPALRRIEEMGFEIHDAVVHVPLAAVLDDLRRDQLTAVALTEPAVPYLGSAGMSALARLGIERRTLPPASSVVVLAATDVGGGLIQAARAGTEVVQRTGDFVGGRQLVDPLTVHAHADRAGVDSPPRQVVTSTTAAIAVFDRSQEIVLRSAARRAPGLPVSLGTVAGWQHATISGAPTCTAGADDWLALRDAARIGVPLAAASPRHPLVAYVASTARPQPAVVGLPLHPVWAEWAIHVFDPSQPRDVERLTTHARADGFEAVRTRPGMWWTRLEVRPRDPWHAAGATLVAGATGEWWVRPAGARTAASRRVCRLVASGERLLLGQYGAVDDESAREVDVWASSGWHAPERLRGVVHQWSARPAAGVGFRLPSPVDLVLALDASPSTGPLTVAVNGTVVAADWQGAGRLTIPAAHLRTGENSLTLSVPSVVRPAHDPRALGVIVRQFRLLTAR